MNFNNIQINCRMLQTPKDTERLLSVNKMIDAWSTAYSMLVVIVGMAQVFLLRRMFNIKPPTANMKMRT